MDLADHVAEEDTQQIVLAEAVGMKARRLEVPLESGTLSIAARQVRRVKQSSNGGTSPKGRKRRTGKRVKGHEQATRNQLIDWDLENNAAKEAEAGEAYCFVIWGSGWRGEKGREGLITTSYFVLPDSLDVCFVQPLEELKSTMSMNKWLLWKARTTGQ